MGYMTAVKICLFLLLAGCAPKPAPQAKAAEKLLHAIGREVQKEFSLQFEGSGGSMPETIDELELLFFANREGSIEEARKIQLLASEKILQKINSDAAIRPYLSEFPFPSSRLSLSISYRRSGSKSIALAFRTRDKIFYYKAKFQGEGLEMVFSESMRPL